MSEALQAQGEQGRAAAEGGPVETASTGFLETPARPIGERSLALARLKSSGANRGN